MNKRQYAVMLALAVVAGLLGGMVSNFLFVGTPVFAQKTPQVAEVIRAGRFEVVDKDGKVRALLSLVDGEPGLLLRDKDGKGGVGLALGGAGRGSGLSFRDKDGKRSVMLAPGADGEPLPFLWAK